MNIAVLHTALEGAAGHASYAPCVLGELRARGHDYWALGHVHERSIRWEHPFVVYPGNTQGRHARETGAKGAMVVKVREGVIASVEHRACDDVRWLRADLDAEAAADMPDLLHGVGAALRDALRGADGHPAAARLTIRARGALGRKLAADPDWFEAETRAQAAALSESLWIEKIRIEQTDDGFGGGLPPELAALMAQADTDADCLRAIRAAVGPLLDKLPPEIGDAEVAPLTAAARSGDLAALVAAARETLEARLGEADA